VPPKKADVETLQKSKPPKGGSVVAGGVMRGCSPVPGRSLFRRLAGCVEETTVMLERIKQGITQKTHSRRLAAASFLLLFKYYSDYTCKALFAAVFVQP